MREWGCAGGESAFARMISTGGFGQVIVDVGLGKDAKELLAAVAAGFVIIAFEPSPHNFHSVRNGVSRLEQNLRTRIHFVECRRDGEGWVVPQLEAPPKRGGFAYVLFAALDSEISTVHLSLELHNDKADMASLGRPGSTRSGAKNVPVPALPLDMVLPAWASTVHLLK